MCAGRHLDWTILRPGGLTDAPATGKIRLAPPSGPPWQHPRADVATVIAALLDNPGTRHQTLELVSGDIPVPQPCAAFPDYNTGPRPTHRSHGVLFRLPGP